MRVRAYTFAYVVLTSGARRCCDMCVRARAFGLHMWPLQGQAIGARMYLC